MTTTGNVKCAVLCACTLLLGAAAATAQSAQSTTLAKLWQSYEQNHSSADEMPEYKKRVGFPAVLLSQSQSVTGKVLFGVSDTPGGREIARLSTDDPAGLKKLSALRPGAQFTAVCTVGFTMKAKWLSMTDCTTGP